MRGIVGDLTNDVSGLSETTSDTKKATVLVTAAHRKPALAITRALGRCNYEVIAASFTPIAQSHFSKYATHTVVYEDPTSDREAFIDDLFTAVAQYDVDVLLPTTHSTTIPISEFRDRFPSAVSIPVIGYETLLTVEDKERLLSIADDLGIPVPATYRPTSLAELDDIAADIGYPAVVKYNMGVAAKGV